MVFIGYKSESYHLSDLFIPRSRWGHDKGSLEAGGLCVQVSVIQVSMAKSILGSIKYVYKQVVFLYRWSLKQVSLYMVFKLPSN